MQERKGKEMSAESWAGLWVVLIAHEVLEDGSLDLKAAIGGTELNRVVE